MQTLRARWLMTESGWLPDVTVSIDDAGAIAAIESGAGSGAPGATGTNAVATSAVAANGAATNAVPTSACPANATPAAQVDLLIPAMPNAHCHAFQHRIAGLTERASGTGDSFWTWRERMYEAIDALDAAALETAATTLYRRIAAFGYGAVAEVEAARAHLGTTPIDWLCANAPVDAHWTLVHATHATGAELERLAALDATVCVCTTTEANLGDSQFDLQRWSALGGSLSIGSDSNVGLDPREELRWLEYQGRLARRERSLLVSAGNPHPGSALWRRAVAGGRRSLGLPAGIGAVGAPAQLLAIACEDSAMSADEALDDLVFAQRATRLHGASASASANERIERN
ncbi:MAG: hypothetical protein KJZ83_12855 [Burkholderiaceae bacterium]|nr:hypothetical protein [Burkholderiaceae bacterium]